MLVKIAAIGDVDDDSPAGEVVVREYEGERDKVVVEEMERQCEFGQADKSNYTLLTDLLGDPLARIRNFLSHVMLVAEYGEETSQIVGVIRGCIKTVTRGKTFPNGFPVYLKLGYILGLRVSPTHRRLGIGAKLVKHLEEWCKQNGADYTYMATDCSNQPSINLFTRKFDYVKFRNPTMLVHPVHAHYKPLASSNISVVRVQPQLAELIYARVFSNSEFFPKDMDNILTNKLSLGTFMALPKKCLANWDSNIESLPHKFAILSIWNTKEVFKLQVKGASRLTYAWCAGSRVLDKLMPWLRLPSIPNVFKDFGVYFLYGLHMKGNGASRLMKSLCSLAHNMARDDVGCGAVVAEVGQWDPVREAIPHWRKFSLDEDMWCIKKITDANHEMGTEENGEPYDWVKSPSSASVIFVDPRDF